MALVEDRDSTAYADISRCATTLEVQLRLRDVLVVFHCSVYELFVGFGNAAGDWSNSLGANVQYILSRW